MKNWITPDDNEFYVGYFPKAPRQIASATKRVIVILFVVMIGVAAITALEQKEFSPANFEYGLVTASGWIPFHQTGSSSAGALGKRHVGTKNFIRRYCWLALARQAQTILFFLSAPLEKKVEGAKVRLTGSLIYGDGKTLLQVEEASNLEYLEGKLAASAYTS